MKYSTRASLKLYTPCIGNKYTHKAAARSRTWLLFHVILIVAGFTGEGMSQGLIKRRTRTAFILSAARAYEISFPRLCAKS